MKRQPGRRPGLYLNGQRFEVAAIKVELMRAHVRLIGQVYAPPQCDLSKWLSVSAAPMRVRYRGLSGLFYIDAMISEYLTFTAVAAGPVTYPR